MTRIKSSRIALVLSLVIHVGLVVFFTHLPPAPKREAPLQVEFREVPPLPPPPAAPKRLSGHFGHVGGSRPANKVPKSGEIHFGPVTSPSGLADSGNGKNLTDEGELGLTENEWGSHGGKFAEIAHYNQYEKLFQEIRGLLNFPSPLAERGISGTVNTRLAFDEKAHCDWKRSRVEGAHPYLRFYTLALLKKLCALETVEHIRFRADQFADLSFTFELTEVGESQVMQTAHERIAGNVLAFYRSQPHSSLEYHLGPLRGYWFAPVVSIDFPWLFEHWDQYVNGRDPLADFKGM